MVALGYPPDVVTAALQVSALPSGAAVLAGLPPYDGAAAARWLDVLRRDDRGRDARPGARDDRGRATTGGAR